MQFFANRQRFDSDGRVITAIRSQEWFEAPEAPRYNFDSLPEALITTFGIITTDGWSTVMINLVRAVGKSSLVYLISLTVLGSYILMNLFLGI